MTERGAGAGSTGRAPRISPLRGLAGQTSGETVALALAARKTRPAERTDEAELYARRLGRCAPVALRAAELLWSELVGTSMPAATAASLGRRLTGFDEQPQAMSTGLTIRTLRTAMGRSPAEAYAAFDPEPFGVGPTSQVHSAMLHDGRWAAVKIRYHGVSQAVRGALAAPELQQALEPIVRAAAGPDAAARIHSVAGELRGRVEQSLSLRAEAAVQAQFAAHYRKHPFIRVPDAIAESSTERVLTMELAGGRGWADAMLGGSVERNRWAEALYRFARAPETALDPRSGNLLFHDDGAVSVLGFRTVRRLSPEQVNALARRDAAVARHDVDELRALHAEFCGYDDPAADPEQLHAWHSRIRGPLAGPGTHTCTAEWAVDAAEAAQPANRPCAAAHQASKTRDCLFAGDVETGLAAVLGVLRAGVDWDVVRAEREPGGDPATPLGKLESAWLAAWTEEA